MLSKRSFMSVARVVEEVISEEMARVICSMKIRWKSQFARRNELALVLGLSESRKKTTKDVHLLTF